MHHIWENYLDMDRYMEADLITHYKANFKGSQIDFFRNGGLQLSSQWLQ